jgi:hypothetical protein
MPAAGLDWLPGPALLSDDEVSRLISVAVRRLGITEVRFTGGEPLLRRGLPVLVAAAAALEPRPEISLTTNGIGLARLAGPLAAAGLDRLNVSLDSLSRQTFKALARRERLHDVLAGLAAAADAGLAPVKVNAVLMRGVNDHEAPDLLGFCLDGGYQLRFPGRGWDAIVIGEYERAFYGAQYASMVPLFEHYEVQLWLPEAGGRVNYASEHDEQAMTVLGLSSKREITRTSIRVRTAMAAQTATRAGTSAVGLRTGTGWVTRGRTRRRPMRPGAGGRTGWSPTPARTWWRGCSLSGWPGTAAPGSPAR